jgi:hypothetical protein
MHRRLEVEPSAARSCPNGRQVTRVTYWNPILIAALIAEPGSEQETALPRSQQTTRVKATQGLHSNLNAELSATHRVTHSILSTMSILPLIMCTYYCANDTCAGKGRCNRKLRQ